MATGPTVFTYGALLEMLEPVFLDTDNEYSFSYTHTFKLPHLLHVLLR